MGIKQTTYRKVMPFIHQNFEVQRMPYTAYLELAKEHLVETVENYKSLFGETGMAKNTGIAPKYQELVWFLFPHQVVEELLCISDNPSFEELDALNASVD